MMKAPLTLPVLFFIFFIFFSQQAAAQTPQQAPAQTTNYNAVNDFSAQSSSNGTWSYGYRASSTSPFALYTNNGNVFGLEQGLHTWYLPTPYNFPLLIHNGTGTTKTYYGITQPPDLLNLYPGTNGEKSVVRWTAPSTGTAIIGGRFEGIQATTTEVTVTHNSTSIFAGTINGFGSRAPFTLTRGVTAGDTIEFAVGANGDFNNDSTGLAATITLQLSGTHHSLSLNGTDAYVSVPYSSSLNITGPITIEAWIKRNPGTYQSIVERYSANDGGYAVRIEADKLCFYTLYNNHDFDRLVSNSQITTGAWHHVAAIYDGNEKQIWIDGVLDSSAVTSFAPGSGAANLRIGVAGDSNACFFSGLIDEVRVTAGVRYVSSFLPDLAQAADGSDTRGLWNFETQTAHDSSGKANHGIFVGGTCCSSGCPASEKYSEWATAQAQAQAAEQSVNINFDNFAHGTTITTQYPPAIFSSSPNQLPVIYNPRANPNETSTSISSPNQLSRYDNVFPFPWNHFAPLTVEFTKPVNNLRFGVAGIDALWGTNIFDVDIYQNNVYKATWTLASLGFGVNMTVNIGQPAYQFGYNEVTKIVIKNIRDPYGIGFDDFIFTTRPPTVDITNPRISGSLNNTTRNAMPGADIQLRANITPSNLTGGTYSWSFTGPMSISGGSSNSPSVTIHAQDVGTITARVTYTLDGVSISANMTINSVLPSITSFTQSQGADVVLQPFEFPNSNGGRCLNTDSVSRYGLGCSEFSNNSTDQPMKLLAAVQSPANLISEPSQSGAKILQAISIFRKSRRKGNTVCYTARVNSEDNINSGWQLDGGDPLLSQPISFGTFPSIGQLNLSMVDYPSTALSNFPNDPIHNLDNDAAYVQDYFENYVYYYSGDPRNPRFQRVLTTSGSSQPVARIAWRWGGQVVYDYVPSLIAPYTKQFTIEPPVSRNADVVNSVRPFREGGLVLIDTPPPTPSCPGTNIGFNLNEIDWPRFFVNQQYLDFLLREADQEGSNYWTSNITRCGFDLTCIDNKRVDVSRAFFYSDEFIARHPELGGQRGTHAYNVAFVYWCYRSYLQREPNAAPDNNWDGYNFWVNTLDNTNPDVGDYKYNQVIRAFLLSIEYREGRFGP